MRFSSAAIAPSGSRHRTVALIGFAATSYGISGCKGFLPVANPAAVVDAGARIEPGFIERSVCLTGDGHDRSA
jgi:hypothetical protein